MSIKCLKTYLKMYSSITVPSAPPLNTTVYNTTDGRLNFTWNPPKCGHRNGLILKYEYQFGDDVNVDNKTTGFTKATHVVLDKLDNSSTDFRVSAHTSKGGGPYSKIEDVISVTYQSQKTGMYFII